MIHGLASSRWLLAPLAGKLRRRGFGATLWGYFSVAGSNRRHGRALAAHLRRLAVRGGVRKLHLVVHSMGSIVARCALQESLPPNLGRVVMIGPPNGGSHMATRLRNVYPFCRPMIELMDRPDSFVNRLPPPPAAVEVGVIAASRDNVIDVERTHLPGQRDHRVVEGWHTGVLWSTETADLTASFLRSGRFASAAATG